MPAPLYARYVPPKKPEAPVAQLEAPSHPTPETSIVENSLYARYVPPKKAKPAAADAVTTNHGNIATNVEESENLKEQEVSQGRKRKRDEAIATELEKKAKSKNKEKKHKTRALQVAQEVVEDASESHDADKGPVTAIVETHRDNQSIDDLTAPEADDVNAILAKYSVTGRANYRVQHEKEQHEVGSTGDAESDDYDPEAGAQAVFAKYRKALTLSQKRQKKEAKAESEREKSPEPELHDLVPIPQPEKAPRAPYKATFSSLPEWITNPRAVQSDVTLPFSELNLGDKIAGNLSRKKFANALAVQAAVLPLLLPGRDKYRGDVCVSAPTGSGKTLSYVLPMVASMQERAMTRLRGIIVVPTRELVTQAREVAEMCAAGTGVKIGTAVGSVALATEQQQLVKRGQKYEPEARKALDEEADSRINLGFDKDDDVLKEIVDLMPDHVPEYDSAVDILICTPGRLVDHIRSTTGFTVNYVEWLVIDEADRLLDSNFQDWVDVVLPALELGEQDPRAIVLAARKEKAIAKAVRKVILSATMTRDLSQLASLRLNRPTLVAIVEPEKPQTEEEEKTQNGLSAMLPSTLKESAVPVGDGSEKPLYLLRLLEQRLEIFAQDSTATVLVFCANDDNATRLARLLSLLSPPLASRTAVLTKSVTTASRRKILHLFGRADGIAIVISTDRSSRGLDVENLTHVVNYDIPPSVTSYVHRVGRTARAGRSGDAWTLVTDTEARWFWKTIAKGGEINRADRAVERVRLGEADDATKESYQNALEQLEEAVKGR
ncbi:uncharacterized protein PV09_04048 [Verruconis gallopava]|uniref:ATP-dependent RNA helicase n=1 Tax=Verruconis gallopava TaxID=253628 RepID=A0A0D1YVZ6_9PEZI|nr:uncharacterized protein PV09_04048 [Verruconis gallopava]KIW04867.1 hypothetical protein PV09_04048 [Verruconis gallopava]